MELTNGTLHIVVTLLLILSAAVIAVFCDLLKRSEERLRVEIAFLSAGRGFAWLPSFAPAPALSPAAPAERASLAAPAPAPAIEPAAAPALEPPAPAAAAGMLEPAPAIAATLARRAASSREPAAATATSGAVPAGSHRRDAARKLDWATPDELAAFAARGARRKTPAPFELEPGTAAPPEHKEQPAVAASAAAPAQPREAAPARPERSLVLLHRAAAAAAAAGSPTVESLPRGVCDRAALARLKRSTEPFSGSIAVVAAENYWTAADKAGRTRAEEMVKQAMRVLETLAGDNGWVCRSAEDELVLGLAENAADAKRKLDQLGERLWDLQLRNLAASSVAFVWGSAFANRERFADVLAEAQGRAEERRRHTVEPDTAAAAKSRVGRGFAVTA